MRPPASRPQGLLNEKVGFDSLRSSQNHVLSSVMAPDTKAKTPMHRKNNLRWGEKTLARGFNTGSLVKSSSLANMIRPTTVRAPKKMVSVTLSIISRLLPGYPIQVRSSAASLCPNMQVLNAIRTAVFMRMKEECNSDIRIWQLAIPPKPPALSRSRQSG